MTNERAYTPSLVLHVLRNPHGWSVEAITAARLQAADEIERLKAAMKGWSSYAWKDKCYVDDVQQYFDSVLKGIAPTSLSGIEVFDEELEKPV